jgi:hypothetical protein
MSEIRFRLAKPSDAKQIANCHWHVRDRYSQGIFLSLGEGFLKTYYKIILDNPWEVVICAENEDGKIIGFSSATLDASSQAINLRQHKVRLGLAAIGAIIRKPSLFREVWQRYKSLGDNNDAPSFVHTEGARGEYWCWLKEEEDSLMSVDLDKAKGNVMYALGCREIFFEVDKFNKQVYKYHTKVRKAEPIEEITLPDGRVRVLLKRELKANK